MNYTRLRSELVKFAHATARCLVMPDSAGKGRTDFLRQLLKFPLTYEASNAVDGVPVTTITELFPGKELHRISISRESLDRHPWNIRLDEEVLIGLLVQSLGARRIFEIGTFDGGTTRVLADKAGEGAEVFTLELDLPEVDFNLLLRPMGADSISLSFGFSLA